MCLFPTTLCQRFSNTKSENCDMSVIRIWCQNDLMAGQRCKGTKALSWGSEVVQPTNLCTVGVR